MIKTILSALLRHGLTALAGYLVTKGIADASVAAQITGGLAAVAGLGLSALDKIKAVQKLDAAANKVAGITVNQ